FATQGRNSQKLGTSLIFDEFFQYLLANESAKDIALIVGRHTFRSGYGNERGDVAISRAANTDTLLDCRIGFPPRLRVGHIDHITLVNIDATGSTELRPSGKKSSILVEDLNAI